MSTNQDVLAHLDIQEAAEMERHGRRLDRIRRLRGQVQSFQEFGSHFRLTDRTAYLTEVKATACCDDPACPCATWDGTAGEIEPAPS